MRVSRGPPTMPELRAGALDAWRIAAPDRKCAAVAALALKLPGPGTADSKTIDPAAVFDEPAAEPGRPARPVLVAPERLPARKVGAEAGRIALLHAVAHIEFNAINLALDAVWRFAGLPEDYYRDWLRVAAEEAEHFQLLDARLRDGGAAYGDLPAHDGLWTMTWATRGDVLARMALVPRTLEARGLDASPAVRQRFIAAGDRASAAVIDRILRDEVGHVATGNRWFRWLCAQRGLDPGRAARDIAAAYRAPALRGPFNLEARRAAGFTDEELAVLGNARQH